MFVTLISNATLPIIMSRRQHVESAQSTQTRGNKASKRKASLASLTTPACRRIKTRIITSESIYDTRQSGCIRLLEFPSVQDRNGPLMCQLITVQLGHDPVYVALSYVWGEPNAAMPILVNGMSTTVGLNLHAALLQLQRGSLEVKYPHVRTHQTPVRFWADAICINQNDVQERNQQVALMTRIYSGAELVVAWLGDGDAEIRLAMDTLTTIYDRRQKHGWYLEYTRSVRGMWLEESSNIETTQTVDACQAVMRFFDSRINHKLV